MRGDRLPSFGLVEVLRRPGGVRGLEPRARRRSVKSFTSSRRMWSALIASAFFRSKRAGLALTSAMSNFATISSIEKTSWSAEKDQPSSER